MRKTVAALFSVLVLLVAGVISGIIPTPNMTHAAPQPVTIPLVTEGIELIPQQPVVAVSLTHQRLMEYILDEQPFVGPEDIKRIVDSSLRWSEEHEVPIFVTLAVIEVESNFKPYLVSSKEAHGVMQIVPKVWKAEFTRLEIEGFPETIRGLHDIDTNIKTGTKILRVLKDRHKTWSKAVCNYNPGACEKYTSQVKQASIKLTWSTM